jgi:hypothetical protein
MIAIKMVDDITVRNAVANDMDLVFDAVKDAFGTVIKNRVKSHKGTYLPIEI